MEVPSNILLWISIVVGFAGGIGFLLNAVHEWQVEKRVEAPKVRERPILVRSIGLASDIGNGRTNNEDTVAAVEVESIFESSRTRNFLLTVADGMGGGSKGEYASAQCIRSIIDAISPTLVSDGEVDHCLQLRDAIRDVNRQLFRKAQMDLEYQGMGTTVTSAVVAGSQVYLANVGDTRAYLIRDSTIHQITRDHSLVREMVERGEITPEEARSHPKRNIITRVVGYYEDVEVDTFQILTERGDRLLLCTDGLHSYLDDNTILRTLSQMNDPQEAVEALISTAKGRGGLDNISVILYQYIP